MRTAPLIAFLVIGGAVIYVLWDVSRRKTISASPSTVNGYAPPVIVVTTPTGGSDALQQQVDALAKAVSDKGTMTGAAAGAAVGSTVGAGVGTGVATGEQGLSRGLGITPIDEATANRLAQNAAANGLVAGTTAGANTSSAAGGGAGASTFDFLAGFLRGAASSEFLRPGGVADKLNLPKWDAGPSPSVGGGGSF